MKFIEKGPEPALLRKWRLANKNAPQNLRYENIPKSARANIRSELLKEQGGICAYTMWRIGSTEAGHIEHVHPQSQPPLSKQISYRNLVFCHPGERAERCPFGAHRKADSLESIVSPLDRSCERRFRFKTNGVIEITGTEDPVAQKTIDVLLLNHDALRLAREAAIQELPIFGRSRIPAKEARRQARIALERNGEGSFREFAVAIHQVWARYADQRAAAELAFSRQSR